MPHPKRLDPAAILDAALEIVEEQGSAGLSLRAVAARLDVKAPSLYNYFPDKAALEGAVIAASHRLMLETLRRHTRADDPETAFRQTAEAYLKLARKRPALYFFAMNHQTPGADSSPEGKLLWNFLLARVGALSGNPDDTDGAVAVWAFLHGFAVLERSGRFGKSGPKGGLARGLDALISQSLRLN